MNEVQLSVIKLSIKEMKEQEKADLKRKYKEEISQAKKKQKEEEQQKVAYYKSITLDAVLNKKINKIKFNDLELFVQKIKELIAKIKRSSTSNLNKKQELKSLKERLDELQSEISYRKKNLREKEVERKAKEKLLNSQKHELFLKKDEIKTKIKFLEKELENESENLINLQKFQFGRSNNQKIIQIKNKEESITQLKSSIDNLENEIISISQKIASIK